MYSMYKLSADRVRLPDFNMHCVGLHYRDNLVHVASLTQWNESAATCFSVSHLREIYKKRYNRRAKEIHMYNTCTPQTVSKVCI